MLSSSVRTRFLESRFESDGSASSSFPIAVCPVPKRLARSNALNASASAPSVPAAPVSPFATAAPVPNRSARALRLAISASTSDDGRCRAKDAAVASAPSSFTAVGSTVAGSGAVGAASAGAGASDVDGTAGSGICASGAVVDSAGGAFTASADDHLLAIFDWAHAVTWRRAQDKGPKELVACVLI